MNRIYYSVRFRCIAALLGGFAASVLVVLTGGTAAFADAVPAPGGGTALTTAGAASADRAAPPQMNCPDPQGPYAISDTTNTGTYNLGTPNNTFSGAAAILKPNPPNSTSEWTFCTLLPSGKNVILNRGLALTSTATSPGADVTVEPPGNGGTGFASQQWAITSNPLVWRNAKTGLCLRIRNSGPSMYQTVTTGQPTTNWLIH